MLLDEAFEVVCIDELQAEREAFPVEVNAVFKLDSPGDTSGLNLPKIDVERVGFSVVSEPQKGEVLECRVRGAPAGELVHNVEKIVFPVFVATFLQGLPEHFEFFCYFILRVTIREQGTGEIPDLRGESPGGSGIGHLRKSGLDFSVFYGFHNSYKCTV